VKRFFGKGTRMAISQDRGTHRKNRSEETGMEKRTTKVSGRPGKRKTVVATHGVQGEDPPSRRYCWSAAPCVSPANGQMVNSSVRGVVQREGLGVKRGKVTRTEKTGTWNTRLGLLYCPQEPAQRKVREGREKRGTRQLLSVLNQGAAIWGEWVCVLGWWGGVGGGEQGSLRPRSWKLFSAAVSQHVHPGDQAREGHRRGPGGEKEKYA